MKNSVRTNAPDISGLVIVSFVTIGMGALSLGLITIGTLVLITFRGWTPASSIASSVSSQALGGMIIGSAILASLASLVGWSTFKRMPTKRSREVAFSGASLGAIAIAIAGLMAWFRGGDVEIFARNFLNFSVLSDTWPLFVRGARNTIVLSALGELVGVVIGMLLAVFAISNRVVVRAPVRVYINIFRGTPLFWQVQFGFFGIVLGLRMDLSPYQVAILILGLNAAAYSAEVFRAGIISIEKGQLEAARSLGMTYLQALRYVLIPQGVRRVIPPLTNEFVILVKDTSLVSILGLTFSEKELLGIGRDLYSSTFNATPFLASAAGYLVITIPLIRVVTMLERKLRSGLTGIPGGA